jgi:hypothetical protein
VFNVDIMWWSLLHPGVLVTKNADFSRWRRQTSISAKRGPSHRISAADCGEDDNKSRTPA